MTKSSIFFLAPHYLRNIALGVVAYYAVYPVQAWSQTKLGLVTSRACPYSCETRRLPKSVCRDWQEAETCYVEDLTKPAEDNTRAADDLGLEAPVKPRRGQQLLEEEEIVPPGEISGTEECKRLYRNELAPPRVNLETGKGDSRFFDRSTVKGTVEGICLQEAGYFERGQKVEAISVQTTRQFKRFNFSTRFRRDREPEIRVYNTAGENDIISLSEQSPKTR